MHIIRRISLGFLAGFLFLGSPPALQAASTVTLDKVDCSVFKGDGIIIQLQPLLPTVLPGDSLTLKGTLTNNYNFALEDAQLRIKVYTSDKEPLLVDDFVAQDGIKIPAKHTQEQIAFWKVPTGLPAGSYTTQFSLEDAHQLAISNLFGVHNQGIDSTQVQVGGTNQSLVSVLADQIKVNDQAFTASSAIVLKEGDPLQISVPVKNNSNKTQVQVAQFKFAWPDGSRQVALNATFSTQTLGLLPGQQQNLTYSLKDFPAVAGVARIILGRQEDQRILEIPFATQVKTTSAFIKHLVITDKGPLACLQQLGNGADVTGLSLKLALTDLQGNALRTYAYDGGMNGEQGFQGSLPSTLPTTAHLKATLTKDSKTLDEATYVLSCSTLNRCQAAGANQSTQRLQLFVLVLLLIVVVGYLYLRYVRKK